MEADSKTLANAGARLVPGLEGYNPWGSQLLLAEGVRVDGFFAHNMFIAGGFAY